MADRDRNLVLMALSEFLMRHPPALGEVMRQACSLYRVAPNRIGDGSLASQSAREMVCYIGRQWARAHHVVIADVIDIDPAQVETIAFNFRKRLQAHKGDNLLRDDLDLMAVRLTEVILAHSREYDHAKARA